MIPCCNSFLAVLHAHQLEPQAVYKLISHGIESEKILLEASKNLPNQRFRHERYILQGETLLSMLRSTRFADRTS